MPEVFLFAGPTLARARRMQPELELDALTVRGPIKRGELTELTNRNPPGTAILVDGLFHHEMAVGHAEIRTALTRGWAVWGLSSMGAIRAREMAALGMRGFGQVYAMFCREDVDFRDDEVTLLHDRPPEYLELSEPLVHIRVGLEDLVARDRLAGGARDQIIHDLEHMWYAERTLAWLAARLEALLPDGAAGARDFLAGFDRYRVKCLDLIRFLGAERRAWCGGDLGLG